MRIQRKTFRWIAVVIAAAALISGCAGRASSPATIETAGELVGTWESGDGFHYSGEDGSHWWAKTAVMLESRLKVEPEGDYWFGDGYHYQSGKTCATDPGVYEIQIVDDGAIEFRVVDEDCLNRELWLAGDSSDSRAWTRVD